MWSLSRVVLCVSLFVSSAQAYNNGVAQKPPLGWQTWCSAGPCGTDNCYDRQIRATAQAMVDNGMKDAGYEWIVLDDCWHPSRDANGTLVPFKDFFPNGMVPVIDFVHSLGLKFGLYTSVGTKTCHGGWSPGSYGFYDQDADLFASWGVDYVKIDWCGDKDTIAGHKNFSRALNRTGRPIALELCRGEYQQMPEWGYAPEIAQVWRATGDHHDEFASTLEQVAAIAARHSSAPFGWAYGDMMMTGGEGCEKWDVDEPAHCPGQTDNEYRSEVSMYSVLGSPLMVGTDIRLMTRIMNETLLNEDMLRINQDYSAPVGQGVFQTSPECAGSSRIAYVRHLSDGSTAVSVTNLANKTANITVCFQDVRGGGNNPCSVSLIEQTSHHKCSFGTSFGCVNETAIFTNAGCRGRFHCSGEEVACDVDGPELHQCSCSGDSSAVTSTSSTITHQVRDVWAKSTTVATDVYSRTLGAHDSILVILSNVTVARTLLPPTDRIATDPIENM